ncbi:hypothetical protein SH2C18_16700 [Clostridium sediminicola]|uniref:YhcN/YlaJ family sporulation lipoprotein n=1 Tax=Clostridium sediminicola TaxID=3114879 RepID=UPI0031F22E17
MKKNIKIVLSLLLVFLSIISIAACDQKKNKNDTTEKTNNMEKNEGDKETGEKEEADYETMIIRNQQFSDSLTQMDEIKEAKVMTYGETSIAGVTLEEGQELNDELKEKIMNEIKDTDESITEVKVTNDEGVIGELTEAEDKIKSGEASENLEENIKGIYEKIE